ncbi:MAG: hypothetical protein JNJ77_07055 [Planctomycetia bacterium]|nr:hypothetical protein [Planctomycetia bacterium]
MPDVPVHLHYMNVNVEGQLPHRLEFGPLYGRLVTEDDISGQVVTVISYGLPRRYFVWSTFTASTRVKEYRGKTVVQGDGWHLCPPYEVPEANISYLVGGNIRDHLFVKVKDEATAQWLLDIVDRYRPPGKSDRLRLFLKQMYHLVGNEEIEQKIRKAWRTIKD